MSGNRFAPWIISNQLSKRGGREDLLQAIRARRRGPVHLDPPPWESRVRPGALSFACSETGSLSRARVLTTPAPSNPSLFKRSRRRSHHPPHRIPVTRHANIPSLQIETLLGGEFGGLPRVLQTGAPTREFASQIPAPGVVCSSAENCRSLRPRPASGFPNLGQHRGSCVGQRARFPRNLSWSHRTRSRLRPCGQSSQQRAPQPQCPRGRVPAPQGRPLGAGRWPEPRKREGAGLPGGRAAGGTRTDPDVRTEAARHAGDFFRGEPGVVGAGPRCPGSGASSPPCLALT